MNHERDLDIEAAIRFDANEDGIYDENIIQHRINEYYGIPNLTLQFQPYRGGFVFLPQQQALQPGVEPDLRYVQLTFENNIYQRFIQNLEAHVEQIVNFMEPLHFVQDDVALVATQKTLDDMTNFNLQQLCHTLGQSEEEVNAMNCSICMGDFGESDDNETYTILPDCKHTFHTNCVKEYLRNYNYHCPVCRKPCGDHEAKIEN